MTHKIGGSVGILLDLHDVGKRRVTRLKAQQQEVAEPDHRSQQVIEVVCDSAGELTDGLHFLRLGELDFEVLLFSHIDKMECESAARERAERRRTIITVVDSTEEQNYGSLPRPGDSDLDRFAFRLPVRRRREL